MTDGEAVDSMERIKASVSKALDDLVLPALKAGDPMKVGLGLMGVGETLMAQGGRMIEVGLTDEIARLLNS